MKKRIAEVKKDGYRIIYLDESFFTTKTIMQSDYTAKKTQHRIPLAKVTHPAYSLVLAISEEQGLEHCEIYRNKFDQEKFAEYLDGLYIANKHAKIALLLDNVRSHKTPEILEKMDELGIPAIFCVPYQPDMNPTEACFSKVKNHYGRKRLHQMVVEEEFDVLATMEESVKQLTLQDIRNCI